MIRLSPILKYQLAMDIQVISTVGGAANVGAVQAAKKASVIKALRCIFMSSPVADQATATSSEVS